MSPADVLKLCKEKKVEFFDLRFMDFPGLWQHTTCPINELTLESFDHGFGFDGSSIRGWQAINESDMLLVPVASTAKIDPFMTHTTLSIICDVRDPITKKEYSRDPRSIARKTAAYLKKAKIADTAYFGPELEFFIFDQAFYDQGINFGKYYVGSREGIWGRGDEDPTNLGYKVRLKEGYFPTPPMDTMQNIRSEMVATLIELGIPVEAHHHEVATGGQCEIDMRYQDLVTMSDNVMMYKYVCKNVAARHGKVVTFMPKPLFQDNGSGMHVHFSLWKGDKPLFAGNKYAGLSELGLARHRRDSQACRGAVRAVQSDDQQLQAAGAGVRGAGESGVQQPQSLGGHPHSDVQRESQDQADRIPLPRQFVQSVSGVQRHRDGGDRRDRK